MDEIVLRVPTAEALRKKWTQHIKHGVVFAPVHPVPKEGDAVQVRLRPAFSTDSVLLRATVAQASVGISVLALEPISAEARATLVALGVEDAAEGPPATPESEEEDPFADVEPAEDAEDPFADVEPAEDAEDPFADIEPAEDAEDPFAEVSLAEDIQVPAAAAPAGTEPDAEEPDEALEGVEPADDTSELDAVQEPASAEPEEVPPPFDTVTRPMAKFVPKAAAFTPGKAKFAPAAAAFKPGPALGSQPSAFRPNPAATTLRMAAVPSAEDLGDPRVVADMPGAPFQQAVLLLPEQSHTGTFGTETWRDALLLLLTEKVTGVLVIRAFREHRWCYVVEGRPVHFLGDQPHPGEFLGDCLQAAGVLDADTWTAALRMQKLMGKLPGELLVATGRIRQEQLDAALTERAQRITRNLMGTNFGSWSFHPVEAVRAVFTNPPVDALYVLYKAEQEGQVAQEDEELVARAESLYTMHVRPVPARAHLLELLPYEPDEAALVRDMLPAGWTLRELVGLGGMPERRLLRFLFTMEAMGFAEFVDSEGPSAKRNRAERILWLGLRDLKRHEPFEALHSHWSSTPDEIKQGHARVLRDLGGARFGSVADDRIRKLLAEIEAAAQELLSRLSTPGGRKEARKGLVADDQLFMACDLLDKQGDLALFKGEFGYAKACFERVLDLDPGGPLTSEHRKRAREALKNPHVQAAVAVHDNRLDRLKTAFEQLKE